MDETLSFQHNIDIEIEDEKCLKDVPISSNIFAALSNYATSATNAMPRCVNPYINSLKSKYQTVTQILICTVDVNLNHVSALDRYWILQLFTDQEFADKVLLLGGTSTSTLYVSALRRTCMHSAASVAIPSSHAFNLLATSPSTGCSPCTRL